MTEACEVIDVHTHLANWRAFPREFISGVASDSLESAGLTRILRASLNDEGERLVQQMDEAGISKSVILAADFGVALGEAEWSCLEHNEKCAEVSSRFPDRFIWFSGVDPRRGAAGLDIFKRSVVDWKCAGLKLYPPCGFELDDERLWPFYKLCNDRGLPILTHSGPSLPALETERNFPQSVRRIASEFKDINFILAHGIINTFPVAVELAGEFENVFLDISAFQVLLPDEPEIGRRMHHACRLAPSKVLFGTDWPLYILNGTQKEWVGVVERVNLAPEVRRGVMSGNARQAIRI